MDDRWESEIIEFGAINITGFRLVDTNRRLVREFYDSWKRLDPTTSIGAGRESISVLIILINIIQLLLYLKINFYYLIFIYRHKQH